ncbi:MAG: ImmA/IrrE family metallo-endopeptidase [Syntrophomonas sp.]
MVSKAKERLHKEIRDEAERTARQLRGKFNMGSRDIGDIFRFIEQSLNYLLIRKSFGSEALDGFAAIYQGERLVVTNSSHILSREKFTAAHEIGHHYFDFKDESNDELIADQQTGCFDQQNLAEFRADCFAAALLMPKEGVEDAY